MTGNRLQWDSDGQDWPHRSASRFVEAAGFRWHVQQFGSGPALLLVHGTGAASHSWRGLAPLLAPHFTVIAPDLPGHGFTQAAPRGGYSLPGMAASLGALLEALGQQPVLAAGHSAGAAILARMSLDGILRPEILLSLNGALLPLGGLAGQMLSPLAKLMAAVPVVPDFFARRASDPRVVARLLDSTGSHLDAEGTALYARLFANRHHAAAALSMMAAWDLPGLARDLKHLATPLILVAADRDRTIPPADAARVKALVPSATIVKLPGLGHLAHEEAPETVSRLILDAAPDRLTESLRSVG
jgi:magnesium chelatase accessory protein